MSSDLRESLLRRPTKTRKSSRSLICPDQPKTPKERYAPVKEVVVSAELEWQHSESESLVRPPREVLTERSTSVREQGGVRLRYWNDSEVQTKEKTLNDKVFSLAKGVQRKLYWWNMIMNTVMRICLINLLVFLALEQKRVYMLTFVGLELTAMLLYLIIMIKMLFTRSDRQSVYFQKIFNESEWADIEAERVMRSHFSLRKILAKIRKFFNPCSKFQRDTKISFLRQEIFKRIELVLVELPFTALFLLNKDDFVTPQFPNFSTWITAGIVLEVLRTAVTYLTIFVYG